MNIENIVFDQRLKKIVKKDQSGEYILKSDLEELKLNENERKFICKILTKRGIELRLECIKKEDRELSSSNYEYGEVSAIGFESKDIPRFAKISYDRNGNVVFEDYRKLDEYVENTLIKNNVRYKKVNIDGIEEYELSLPLNLLVKCGFSELELKHVMEYLDARNIIVTGINSTLDDEFSNYKFLRTYKSGTMPVNYDWNVQQKKFAMLNDLSLSVARRKEIREDLIQSSIRLVSFVAYKYAIITGIDINELNSYGYEGLIKAVDGFDLSLNCKFISYAIPWIKGAVLNGIGEILGFKHHKHLFSSYVMVKNIVEGETGKKVSDNPELNYVIVDEMVKMLGLKEKTTQFLLNQLFIVNHDTLDCLDSLQVSDTAEDFIFSNDMCANIKELLETLTPRESDVLRLRFGFVDDKIYTLNEIGRIFGVSPQRIRDIKSKNNIKSKRGCWSNCKHLKITRKIKGTSNRGWKY